MYLKAKNYNIYFLQDIHFTKQDENIINHNGVQKSFSAHLSQTQGVLKYLLMIVAILKCSIWNKMKVEIYIILDVKIEKNPFLLINIYGPNNETPFFFLHSN